MNTRRVNAAADVICRAMENGRRVPAAMALALESAQMLMSPEIAAELEQLRDEVAALRAERHSTNEALDDAAKALRANRDRIARLEFERGQWEKTTHRLAGDAGLIPPVRRPVEPKEDPHDSPLHHRYRLGRDLPPLNGMP